MFSIERVLYYDEQCICMFTSLHTTKSKVDPSPYSDSAVKCLYSRLPLPPPPSLACAGARLNWAQEACGARVLLGCVWVGDRIFAMCAGQLREGRGRAGGTGAGQGTTVYREHMLIENTF